VLSGAIEFGRSIGPLRIGIAVRMFNQPKIEKEPALAQTHALVVEKL
jgi:hypothetical protein